MLVATTSLSEVTKGVGEPSPTGGTHAWILWVVKLKGPWQVWLLLFAFTDENEQSQ